MVESICISSFSAVSAGTNGSAARIGTGSVAALAASGCGVTFCGVAMTPASGAGGYMLVAFLLLKLIFAKPVLFSASAF